MDVNLKYWNNQKSVAETYTDSVSSSTNAANLKNALVESLVGLSLMVQARAGIHWKSLMTTWLKRIIKRQQT